MSNQNKSADDVIFNLNSLILQNKIGSGSFGKVYLVKDKKTSKILASKISNEDMESDRNEKIINIAREINIISKLNHPSIVKFIGFSPTDFKKRPRPVIITEYVSNGSLSDLISKERTHMISNDFFTDTNKLIIIYGIASGMAYLHSHDIIHRDLKPENILIDEYLLPKIADFGLSKVKHDEKAIDSTIGVKGTPIYISPEIWLNYEYGKASDVYAFAFIVYEILTNEKPFDNYNIFQIQFKILKGLRPEFNKPIPQKYKNLIERCWSEDPTQRPTFDQIVDHLKNDKGYITDKIDENKFVNYIDFINDSQISFNPSDFNIDKVMFKPYPKLDVSLYKDINLNTNVGELLNLNKENQVLVKEAQNDVNKQFFVGKCFIEGSNDFPQNTELGVNYLDQSLQNGSIESFSYYCNLLIKGNIIHKNHKKVKKMLNKLPKDQESVYSFLYGKLYKNEENYTETKKYFEQSIELDNPEAMYEYGKMIYSGKIAQFNKEEAIKYFMKSIDKGCPKAMLKYGLILIDENNFDEGIKYIKNSVEKGYPKAMYHYSKILEKQIESKKQIDSATYKSLKDESIKYLKEAAKQGNIKAMHDYAIQLENDKTFSEEIPIYLKKCSDKGDFDSMYHYGEFLLQENNPQKNTKASKFIRIAADNGHSKSMCKYGEMLLYGHGVQSDAEEASKYYQMAIDNGNTEAMVQYSTVIKDDKEKAFNLLKMAGDQGNDTVIDLMANVIGNTLGTNFSREDILRYYNMYNGEGDPEAIDSWLQLLKNATGISITREQAIDLNKKMASGENFISQGDLQLYLNSLLRQSNDANNEEQTNSQVGNKDFFTMCSFNDFISMMSNLNGKALNEAIFSKQLFKISADSGSPEKMFEYAASKLDGDEESQKEAAAYFKKAADSGHPKAMFFYALMLSDGKAVPQNKEEAANYLKMSADKGDLEAIATYAQYLFKGEDVPQNYEEAAKYYKMAADKGNATSMNNYAYMLDNGLGVPENKEEAAKYYKMAADNGNGAAMGNFAYILENGLGVPENKEEAAKYYKMAADAGNTKAMYLYANMILQGDVDPQNSEEEAIYCKMLADIGNLLAINKYAYMLHQGIGVEVNKEEALKYYKMAADKEDASAMNSYAEMLEKGEGIAQNKEEAAKYYKMSADNGNTIAMNNYAYMLKEGEGVGKNIEESAKYYKMSADNGNTTAMNNYARMLKEGKGVAVNKKESAKYFKMSADKNDIIGLICYAFCLIEGDGVPQNPEEAAKYYKIAADMGNVQAMNHYAFAIEKFKIYPNDPTEIFKYYKMAADNGSALGMIKCADILQYGKGIPIDKKKALEYFKMAVEEEEKKKEKDDIEKEIYYRYSIMLYNGEGCEQDINEALKYFKLAAEKGQWRALFYIRDILKYYSTAITTTDTTNINVEDEKYSIELLADNMRNGYKCPINKVEALNIYKRLLDRGNYSRICELAQMIYNGEGVTANKEEALRYYKIAYDKGIEGAKENIDFISMEIEFDNNFDVEKDDYLSFETRANIPKINRRRRKSLISLRNIDFSVFNNLDDNNKSIVFDAENGDQESTLYIARSFIEGNNNFPQNKHVGSTYLEELTKRNKNALAKKLYKTFLFNDRDKKKVRQYMDSTTIFYSSKAKLELAKLLLSSESFDIDDPNLNQEVNFTLAKQICKEAADSGNPEAMLLYGKLCLKEKKNKYGQIKRDLKEAFIYFKLAYQNGNIQSLFEIGFLTFNGVGVKKDQSKAAEYFKIANDKGNLSAAAYYGLCLLYGIGEVQKNEAEGLRLIKNSCDNENVHGISCYAFYLSSINETQLAYNYYKKAANRGFVEAILNVAKYYHEDKVNSDIKKAIKYYELAVEEGSSIAAFNLFSLFNEGNDEIEPNFIEMNKFRKIAADLGNADAIFNYIGQYIFKQDVVDIKELSKYYHLGIYYGIPTLMYNFGMCLIEGKFFPRNIIKAAKYFKMAGSLGNIMALAVYTQIQKVPCGIED